MNRDDAYALLCEYTQTENLRRHMLAVEAAMRAYARKFGEDEEKWGIVGLLHDFDYERWPTLPDHPLQGAAILAQRGYPEDVIYAIKSHADYLGDCPRRSLLDKTLFACDELCGLISACALVRPEGIAGLQASSVRKKMKQKSFAAAVKREDIDAIDICTPNDSHAEIALACLEYGAVDIVPKTWGGNRFAARELAAKVKEAAAIDVRRQRFARSEIAIGSKPRTAFAPELGAVVIIGASTGGPQALMNLVPRFPRAFPACIIVVQHMPVNFTKYFAERLDARSMLDASEAQQGDYVAPGRILVAPGGQHLLLGERDGRPSVLLLDKNERQQGVCPSIDFAMTSFAPVFRERLVGVVLTGMGRDGSAGCAAIRANGGTVICQDRTSSLVFGMPGAVVECEAANYVVPLDGIADRVTQTVGGLASREIAYEH